MSAFTVSGANDGPIITSGLTMTGLNLLGKAAAGSGPVEQLAVGTGLVLGGASLTLDRLTATAALNFGALSSVTPSRDLTITVTGAADGDVVALGVVNASVPAGVVYFAWVSAADTVTVRAALIAQATSPDPASGNFKVFIIR